MITMTETQAQMDLRNLDQLTREHMLDELQYDQRRLQIYYSKRLNEYGRSDYVPCLREAIADYDQEWLRERLEEGRMVRTETSEQSHSGFKKTPHDAARILSEGEFNRYYMRGLCKRAIEEEIPYLVVYRAKVPRRPDIFSEGKIGKRVNPYNLLLDLRKHVGGDTKMAIPPGPNSGLSVCLPIL